jgi:hypothetical protein
MAKRKPKVVRVDFVVRCFGTALITLKPGETEEDALCAIEDDRHAFHLKDHCKAGVVEASLADDQTPTDSDVKFEDMQLE